VTTTSFVVPAEQWTAADVHARVGAIPLDRIRTYPAPGTATEADVLEAEAHGDHICELVDGILVEKPMGSYESLLAGKIIHWLCSYLESNNVGVVLGEAGMLAFLPGQVRVPDVSLIRWERIPGRQLPQERIYAVVPDLAVEVLSPSNTEAEMRRKLHEYFSAGSRLVWYIAPETRTARAYTAEDQWQDLGPGDSLSGGDVLPGFVLSLDKLFGSP
jgi:Uma2 family endonuclease